MRLKGHTYGRIETREDGSWARTSDGRSWLPPGIGFYFEGVAAYRRGEAAYVNINVFAEGENDITLEKF